MPNSKHLTHGISNLVSLITKTKLRLSHGEAVLESATLAANLDGLAKEIPDPKRHASNFEPAEDVKLVPLDPTDPNGKALSIGATLDPK
jgi:hypothetical protein